MHRSKTRRGSATRTKKNRNMKIIYKYEAPQPFSTAHLQLPIGARFLKCLWRDQLGAQMWFLVDTMEMYETRSFTALPTGGTIDESHHTYIDTYFELQQSGADYVWHVFEIDAKEEI